MQKVKKQIKILLVIYVTALAVSGFTAMIAPEGIRYLVDHVPPTWNTVHSWLMYVHIQIQSSPKFLLYGYDWLAFAHYVIALIFWGVWKEPVKNKWVVEWAMIASLLIFPLAFGMGYLRGIPFWWQLIDCSFGVGSIIPLLMIHRRIRIVEREEKLEDQLTPKYI